MGFRILLMGPDGCRADTRRCAHSNATVTITLQKDLDMIVISNWFTFTLTWWSLVCGWSSFCACHQGWRKTNRTSSCPTVWPWIDLFEAGLPGHGSQLFKRSWSDMANLIGFSWQNCHCYVESSIFVSNWRTSLSNCRLDGIRYTEMRIFPTKVRSWPVSHI